MKTKKHLHIVRTSGRKSGFVAFVKSLLNGKKEQKQKYHEDFLRDYFSRFYEKQDKGKVEIPYFLKARQKVESLKIENKIEETVRNIKRGIAC